MYYRLNGNILPHIRLLDRVVVEPPYVHKKRRLNEYVFYAIKSGSMELMENGVSFEVKEGDFLLLDPKYTHMGTKATTCDYVYVHFVHDDIESYSEGEDDLEKLFVYRRESLTQDSRSFDRYETTYVNLPKRVNLRKSSAYHKIHRLLQDAIDCNKNQMENYKTICACKLMEVFVEIARESLSKKAAKAKDTIPASHTKVHDLLDFLNANYKNEISSEQIEAELDCNFDYINRIFKKLTGVTIFAYLTDLRIQKACELLSSTSLKVGAIAHMVGFADETYFYKVFKKARGVSPGQYEKN